MKPLVYYCRWQRVALRLQGRDTEAVWGHLVYKTEGGQEETREFRYNLSSAELVVQDGEGALHYLLDEKGVPLPRNT